MWLNILIFSSLHLVKKYRITSHLTRNNFINHLEIQNPNDFISSLTNPEEISDIIQPLKLNKSTSFSSLSLKVLKSIKGIISVPLCQLINKSFTSGVFPSYCKIAKIVRIFKNELRIYCNSYRSISIFSNIEKTHILLMVLIEDSNCFYYFQYGFRLTFLINTASMSVIESAQNKQD